MTQNVNDEAAKQQEFPAVVGTAVAVEPVRTVAELQAELRKLAQEVAERQGRLDTAGTNYQNDTAELIAAIDALAADKDLMVNPLVRQVVFAYRMVKSDEDEVDRITATVEAATKELKAKSNEYAAAILPTLEDKTILRTADGKAVVTVAEKRKETAWNPVLAFQFADSDPATKHYIIRTVDAERFKKDADKGIIKPLPGTYEVEVTLEVRVMSEALKKFN